MVAYPRSRSYLGIVKEASRPSNTAAPTAGTAPSNSWQFIPFTSITPHDVITYLDDKGIRGSMTEEYNVIQGQKYSEFDIAGDVFPDTIPWFLTSVLGDVATTGASAPYTHTVSLLNSQAAGAQPTTYQLWDYYGAAANQTRVFAGVQFASVDFKFTADALLTYSAKGMGYASLTPNNDATASFSTVTPLPSWTGSVTLAGSATAILADGNCNISRPVTPIFTVDGNQFPYQMFSGPLSVSGAMTLVFEGDTQLNYYLNNTQPSLVIDFTQGTGAGAQELKIQMTKCAFTDAKIDRSKDYIELSVNYKALANTTDIGSSGGYAPVLITAKNAVASGIYK